MHDRRAREARDRQFSFGLPEQPLLGRVKRAGCRVISSATTVEEARWLEAHGADAVIAQGCEAGGNRGMFLARNLNEAAASQPSTLALVPQIVDAVRVPVIAAGGIADGRGIAAAFALGAAGIQLGTAFLLCPEAATPPLYREALRDTRADATVLTSVFTGRPARALANRFAGDLSSSLDPLPEFPLPLGEITPLRAKAEREGNTDFTPFWSGQAAPLASELPAAELMIKLAEDGIKRLRLLDRLSNSTPPQAIRN